MDKVSEMKELIAKIVEANYNYYTLDKPTISDKEWDALYDRLLELEQQSGIVLPDSPTQKVGDTILTGFTKYKHKYPMYSLAKCRTRDALYKWVGDIQKDYPNARFSLEYKYDGLSIVIEYNNGKLFRAGTRGNGTIGEDVTAQVRTIKNVPHVIPYAGDVIVRGEVMMTNSAFRKYNATADEPLKNPRNGAAGALRNLDPKVTASRNLSAFLYSVEYVEDDSIHDQERMLSFLRENGFDVEQNVLITNDFDVLWNRITDIDQQKKNYDILIDGVVVKVVEQSIRDSLGFTAKFPRWAMAFKFEAEEVSTTLLDVIWQVGRTGKITPIACLDPVELAGATISRATLNNIGDIMKKKVSINSRVFVRRSNEVIPEIMGLAERSADAIDINAPRECPCCGYPLVEIGANLFCKNEKHCIEQIADRLTHFCSRDAMNITGLSEKTIAVLNQEYNVAFPYELYGLSLEQLLALPSFKDKKAENLLEGIEKSKKVDFANFIFSLGILNIGKKSAYVLSRHFSTLDELMNAKIDDLLSIYDFGEVMAQSVVEYFADENNVKNIQNLLTAGVTILYANASKQSQFFTGKTIVLTGTLEKYKRNELTDILQKKGQFFTGKTIVLTGTLEKYKRNELTDILQKKGANVTGSVSAKTDFVVVGADAGSKLTKAQNLGIKLIFEQDLDDWLNQ